MQPAAGLGDHPFPYRHRVEAAVFQLRPQPVEEDLDPLHGLDIAGGLAVHPGRARPSVAPHPIPRHEQKRRIGHQVEQIVEPPMRILSCPTVQFGLDPQYPVPRHGAVRLAGVHQRFSWHSSSSLPACWPPSPCARLSRARTTTGPPSHPPAVGWQRAVPTGRAGYPIRSATAGWFPRSPRDRSAREAPSSTPAASPRLRRRPSAWPPHRPQNTGFGVDPSPQRTQAVRCTPAHIRQVRAGTTLTGRQPLVRSRCTFWPR
jgi:hypothetical protein